ncbi:MAG: hypothetical protein AAF823_03155 [Planctomycetota bacterium]
MGKNIAIIILSVVLILSLAGNLLMGIGFAAMTAAMGTMATTAFTSTLTHMTVVENVPAQASTNAPFTIEFEVTNHDSAPQILHAIDLNASLLNGITVTNISPSPTQTLDQRSGGFGPIKYIFNHAIPPGQTQTFAFECTGTQPGFWTDTVTVYDATLASETLFVTLHVQ